MFEFVRSHTRLFQGLLVLLIFPSFVFFGVQGYTRFSDAGNEKVASVDGQSITKAEWDAAHQRNVEGMRRQMPNVDVRLFDSPQARQETLDALIRERVLLAAANKQHLFPHDDRLKRLFFTDAQFAGLRTPENTINKDILAAQGMTPEIFEQRLRTDLGMRQVLDGVTVSAIAPKAAVNEAVQSILQRREVQAKRFDAKDYASKVNPTDAQIEAYHKANEAAFRVPEQAEIEYVVLDVEGLKKTVSVSDDELKRYYAENASRYTAAEERRASHILIKADKAAPAAERQKAKAKAEQLLEQLRKAPTAFPELARKHSEDEGSAARGGDLDFFGRGAMVKPFEDAAFGMKPGEISPVIESDFGYHVIRLEAVRGGEKKSFDAVRVDIENEVRRQLAQRKFAEVAEQFTNTVYEQADSLQPAVDKFKLDKRTATVTRTPAPGATGPLASAKLLEALFSTEVLSNKRNTDAVDVGGSTLVSARVTRHQPARVQPLAEVRDAVRQAVVRQLAAEQARKEGEALLAQLKQNPATALPETMVVFRGPVQLPAGVLDAVMRADAAKLPSPIGVDLREQGYWVGKVTKILPPEPEQASNPDIPRQYARAWGAAEGAALYEALKTSLGTSVKAPAPAGAASAAGK